MSLISGAHFVAPLRSKVQVVGIFALAVLVAVVRLSESHDPSSDRAQRSGRQGRAQVRGAESSLGDDVSNFLSSRRRAKSSDGERGVGDLTVDQLLASEPEDDTAPVKRGAAASADSGAPERFDDIRRSLGLE